MDSADPKPAEKTKEAQSAVALLLPSRLTVVGMLAISLFEGAKVCSVS